MMINYNRENSTEKKKNVDFQVKPLRKPWSFQFLGEIEFYNLFISAARLKHSLNLFKKLQ